jgi:hypothetical protein
MEELLKKILEQLTKTNALLQRNQELLEILTRIIQAADAESFMNDEMQREIHGAPYPRRG